MDKTERELRDMLADRKLVRWPTEPQWVAIWTAANARGYTDGVSAAVYNVAPDLLDADWVKLMGHEQRDMMWSEIRLRRSVAPFRKTRAPMSGGTNPGYASPMSLDPDAATALQAQVAGLVAQDWEVLSDGPSGVQLRAPRTIKWIDVLGFAAGLVSFALGAYTRMAYGVGCILIVLALLNYFVFRARETKFLSAA